MDILKNIRETALTHPKRYAVQSREQKLTYEELEEYSNRLAVWIAKNSQDRKRPVIVYGHKNPYMVVCLWPDRIYGGSHGCDYNREVIAGDHCPGQIPSGRP